MFPTNGYKIWTCSFSVLIIFAGCLIACTPAVYPPNAQDATSLLGTWNIDAQLMGMPRTTFTMIINRFEQQRETENIFKGSGCLLTAGAGGSTPLELEAELDLQTESFVFNGYGTLVGDGLDSKGMVIKLVGKTFTADAGKSVSMSGKAHTENGEGEWKGERGLSQITDCPPWDERLTLRGEVGLNRDLAFDPVQDGIIFSMETNVVSSQLRVEGPDGTVTQIPYHSDIFTAGVDFVASFFFQGGRLGTPLVGKPYTFTLIDGQGEIIPSIQDQEAYLRCGQGAATNLKAIFIPGEYLEIGWDAPELIPGEFDPKNGHGFYQLVIDAYPKSGIGMIYGAEVTSTSHRIPWKPFEPGSAGQPDGHDYGVSLDQFSNGQYLISMGTYNFYDAPEGEIGFDCRVQDSRHVLLLSKQAGTLSIQPGGSISGYVLDKAGKPLTGIAVDAAGMNNAYHDRICSSDNGFFMFQNLPLDSYILSAGQFGTEECAENTYITHAIPALVLTFDEPIRTDVKLLLEP